MLQVIKTALIFLVAGIGLLFWWQNRMLLDAAVPVSLRLPLVELRPMPPHGPRIDFMLVVAFAGGFFLAYGLGLVRRAKSAMEIRRLRKQSAPGSGGTGLVPTRRKSQSTDAATTSGAGTPSAASSKADESTRVAPAEG